MPLPNTIHVGFKKAATHVTCTAAIVVALLLGSCGAKAAINVVYPNIDGAGRDGLGYQMLSLALSKSNQPYSIRLAPAVVNQERALAMLQSGQINVVDTGGSEALAERFDPVYRPIDLGLLGWRVFVIRKDEASLFANVHTLDDLKRFTAGQGVNWPDVRILRSAGLRVIEVDTVENLISMVRGKRFGFLPLGATEAYGFLSLYGQHSPELNVEKTVALVYRFGNIFYLKRGNPELKAAIERGLDAALADGSLLRLLKTNAIFQDAFERAELKNRLIIRIPTPSFPKGLDTISPDWWFDPLK